MRESALVDLYTLDYEEVIRIYEQLVRDFAESGDPIEPAGIRDENLLRSAVGRQNTALGGVRKYKTAVDCAAALGYGICNNHPFYNGNKRTALVAILVALDKNKLGLWGTDQDELYRYMVAVASHGIAEWVAERLGIDLEFLADEGESDVEVRMMATWLRQYAATVTRGEKRVTYRELRRLLKPFNYELHNPDRSFISVVHIDPQTGKTTNIDSIIYPGEGREVEVGVIKRIRQRCSLREEDGVDSDVFYYQNGAPVNEFINKYRLVLRQLADA
jgi:death-on-curing family protein